MTFDGRCGAEIEKRINSAWSAFFGMKHLLLCDSASIVARLKVMDRVVPNTLLWCAGTWCPTQNDLKKIWSAQLAMVKKIVRVRRRLGEELELFMPRANRLCSSFLHIAASERWDRRVHVCVARFAGHVARIHVYDPERLTV